MSSVSPINGLPIPDDDSPNDPPIHFGGFSDVIDSRLVSRFASATARDTAFATWTSAGNTMSAGMMSFTQSDGRYWRWSASSTAWVYAGGKPPPIVAITLQGGWTNLAGHTPGVYLDSNGLLHFVGACVNTSSYSPNVGALVAQLPSGYIPAVSTTGICTLGITSGAMISFHVNTSGVLAVDGSTLGTVPAGSGHWLEAAAPMHLSYTGVVPLA